MGNKKTVHKTKKNAKGQTVLDGSISLGGKESPTAPETLPVTTVSEGDAKPDLKEDYALRLIRAGALPQALTDSFPKGVNKGEMAKVYEKVAKTTADLKLPILYEYAVNRVIEASTPNWRDSESIRSEYSLLELDNSDQIEAIFDDKGWALDGRDEIKLAYLQVTYEWAYDSIVDYLGGYQWDSRNNNWASKEVEIVEDRFGKGYTKYSDWRKKRHGF